MLAVAGTDVCLTRFEETAEDRVKDRVDFLWRGDRTEELEKSQPTGVTACD